MSASAVRQGGRGGRNVYIDMLRGVSILLVMLLHFSLSYHLQISPLQRWISIPTLRAIFYNGNYGVDIFFVISGFLITSNALDRYGSLEGIDVWHFYRLRFFRLYPLVLLALLVITVLGLAGLHHFSNIHRGVPLGNRFFLIADLSVLTFWHNLLMQWVGYFNYAMNIYWSLSVEEVFYLVFPLILVTVRRTWQLAALACVCVVAGPIYRDIHRDNELFFLYGNAACIDLLTYGCVAAGVARMLTLGASVRWVAAALSGIAGAVIYMRGIHGHEALGASVLGMLTAIYVIAVDGLPAHGIVRRLGMPLAWLGSHSYELYLFHIVVLGLIVESVPKAAMTPGEKLPMLAAFLLLSAVLAWMAARWYGNPLNRVLRHRFASKHARVLDTAPVGEAPV